VKVGIDLDGTAWKYREFFSILMRAMQKAGLQVGIITAHCNMREEDLQLFSNRRFPTPDFYISKVEGERGIPSREWKIKKCFENGIEYLFDDFDTDEVRLVRVE